MGFSRSVLHRMLCTTHRNIGAALGFLTGVLWPGKQVVTNPGAGAAHTTEVQPMD